ncbi:receptor expression-enhancing protein 5/6 [Dioscorea alata]|uniref:Receptor expression-enhancing protein 5/6 n=1 Tax=Dioscorea alata TaxID=55571 RepID=A0ACB7V958_DIOAL|nr:receptor expression-enhancing protein 5/6 [Dioscorea alata]
MGYFWTFLTYLNTISGPTITLLYPLYASIQALESPAKLDDEQWLAYWILYSFLTLLEMIADPILKWIPIWYQMKVILVAWLVLPQFRGAAFLYERFVREKLRQNNGIDKVNGDHVSPSPSSSSPKKDKKKFLAFVTSKKSGQVD